MGSNNSQQQPVPQQGPPQQQWAHSFPRDPQRQSHLKVLPDLDSGAKLRITNNGAILHSGGTISGRKGPEGPPQREGQNGVHRSRSVSSPHHPQFPPHRDPLHRSQTHLNLQPPGAFNLQAKRFGSEPDLRVANDDYNAGARHRISREKKKKTKAPAPPPGVDSSSPESIRYGWGSQQQEPPVEPPRRLRLFKTRAESKQKPSRKEDFDERRDSRYLREDPPKHELRTEVIEESYRKREEDYRKPSIERDARSQERYNDRSTDRRYERNERFSREEFLHQRNYQNAERMEDRRENFDAKPRPELRRQKSFEQSKSQEMYEKEQKFERSMSQTRSKDRGEGGVMIRGRERELEVRQPLRKSAPPANVK